MIYVVVNGKEYEAEIFGLYTDREWDDRESKTIHCEMDYALANETFKDGTTWSIKQVTEIEGEEPIVEVFDNSDFNIRGDLTVHTDGTVSVKMGKTTDLEVAYELLYGGKN